MIDWLFNKHKTVIFYEVEKDNISEEDNEKISKEVKKYSDNYFDIFTFGDKSYIVVSKFKVKTKRCESIIKMFSLLIFSYSKKKDIKIFKELLFKVKENNKYKKITLRFNDKRRI